MKLRHYAILLLIALGIGALGFLIYRHSTRTDRFLKNAFIQLSGDGGTETVRSIPIDTGDSFSIILEHSCCSGAGFDAVAIRTSSGAEYESTNAYCGMQDFVFEFPSTFKTLADLDAFLLANGFNKH